MVEIQVLQNNLTRVQVCGIVLWFSYTTVVAFAWRGNLRVSQNYWSNTTGKHLNKIDGGDRDAKKHRLSEKQFDAAWAAEVEPIFQANGFTRFSGTGWAQGIGELQARIGNRRRVIGKLKSHTL